MGRREKCRRGQEYIVRCEREWYRMKKQMDEFMNEVARKIRKRLGSGYKAEWNVYYKNNGVPRIGLVISDGVNTASSCIFMDGYYTLYREHTL